MSRETLKDFLASIGSPADSISLGTLSDENGSGDVDRGDDLGIDPNTGEQLIQLTDADKGLLGDYVNYIATHYRGGNAYGIAGGNKASIDNNRGSSVQDAETSNDSDVFAKQATTLGDTLGNYSNSGKFESTEAGLDVIIDKTSANQELDGHTLLAATGDEIDKTGSTNPGNEDNDHRLLKQMTTEMLQRNNRFSPGTNGVQYSKSRTESNNEIDSKDIAKAQNSFGAHNTTGESFIQEKLKSVGASMLLKAAGLDVDTINPDSFDAASISDNIKSSIISRDLEAGNAYNSPVDRDSRGAFDSSSAQPATTVHTVPGLEFQGENATLNDKILKSFDALLSDVLVDDVERTRDNKSVYTTNSYHDSVERFLNTTIRNEKIDNKDKAYFASIARSVLREESESIEQKEKIRKFLDVFAVLGDTDLVLFYGIKGKEKKRIWDVDQLKDGPATRISKSRSKNGFSTKSLAWRASSMPSMYHMPMSILRSVQRTGSVSKKNPVKAMMGSSLGEKTYLAQNLEPDYDSDTTLTDFTDGIFGDQEVDTTRNKIPKAMVDIYEDMLDAEYVPFYFHDLRTNEIVAFHAFLSSLSDSFSANHTAYEGYGRMDDVQIYKNTKRMINGKFTLVATSKEDFDEMWYKVNKLVEMLYPQWSHGETVKAGTAGDNTQFMRPFSQIPAISPMIRLRIGDVIRGNYSRFNLGRLFGSGHVETYINAKSVLPTTIGSLAAGWNGSFDGINSVTDTINEAALQVFMIAFGSPLQFLDLIPDDEPLGGEIKRLAFQVLSHVLDNGFVNPFVLDGINKLKNPDVEANLSENGLGGVLNREYGPVIGNVVLIKPSQGKYRYISDDKLDSLDIGFIHAFKERLDQGDGKPVSSVDVLSTDSSVEKVLIDRHLKCRILGKKQIDTTPDTNKETMRTFYSVVVIDPTVKYMYKKILTVSHEDVIVDPDWMFENYFAWFLDPVNNAIDLLQDEVNDLAASAGLMGDSIDLFTTTFEDFMSPYNNSITKSFEESAGRGLAGFIGKLSYDLVGDTTNWEIDHGSRAPMKLEITFDFKPVHDIAPGLDADGFSRAPVYNVGSIMNNIAGDQQGEALGSKNRYNKAANDAVKKEK